MEVYLLRPGQQEVSVAIVTAGPPIRDTPYQLGTQYKKPSALRTGFSCLIILFVLLMRFNLAQNVVSEVVLYSEGLLYMHVW